MRAFVAIEIPPATKEGMTGVVGRLKDAGVDARWIRPEGIHLTLKFLGEVDEERAPAIIQALALALIGTERFQLGIQGVGTFPNPAAARVVWVGITGDIEKLVSLQAAVERSLADVGLEPDSRPYTPHLTLGRIRHIRNRGLWLKGLKAVGDFRLPGFDVASISLIRSELTPAGAVHRELGRVAFTQGPG